jgi:hypothetical protein
LRKCATAAFIDLLAAFVERLIELASFCEGKTAWRSFSLIMVYEVGGHFQPGRRQQVFDDIFERAHDL